MTRARILKLSVQGFRAFGKNAQTLDLTSPLAVVWGPNSQGKSSLAEAFEFLLTGDIVRRALVASGQDEFADALRNAHLPPEISVVINAELLGSDGDRHTITRTLKSDYGKKQGCSSILELDGRAASELDLVNLGVVFSQPPLRAPVLAQHTLSYLFSARPQDRANYFKGLLEVTDLDELRSMITSLEAEIAPPQNPLLKKFDLASAIPLATDPLEAIRVIVPKIAEIDTAFSKVLRLLLEANSHAVPSDPAEGFGKLKQLLIEKRNKAFPVSEFEKATWSGWTAPTPADFAALSSFLAERSKVDADTLRLTNLFREALAIPAVAAATDALNCPLCETASSLTPERLTFLRESVAGVQGLRDLEKRAVEALNRMKASNAAVRRSARNALPAFMRKPSRERQSRGFRVTRIRTLLGAEFDEPLTAWLSSFRDLKRAIMRLNSRARALESKLDDLIAAPDTLTDVADVRQEFEAIQKAAEFFASALVKYTSEESAVATPLKALIDAESNTQGWEELIDLSGDKKSLRDALVDEAVYFDLKKEIGQALKQIEKGSDAVLEDKFNELSLGVQRWWDLLRPDEPSFFAAVKPRPGARRTVDFKAGLATNEDRSAPKLRDAIAVFSQSQLHCLGLAVFLARAVHESHGFIVLDDPILTSDEDYRAYFNTSVLEALIDADILVVVLTQDQRTWKDLAERYLHKKVSVFKINLQSPAEGAVITNTADDLASILHSSDVCLRGGHPDLHKQGGEHLRNAAERFCKELLVKDRRSKGDKAASILDYDGKSLGELGPKIEALLKADPAHPGKFRAIGKAVGPAKHDDAIPSKGSLRVAHSDLSALKKIYL